MFMKETADQACIIYFIESNNRMETAAFEIIATKTYTNSLKHARNGGNHERGQEGKGQTEKRK
jgi:hypothetical protein